MQRIRWISGVVLISVAVASLAAGCGQGGSGTTTTSAAPPPTTASTAAPTTAAPTTSTATPTTAGTTTTTAATTTTAKPTGLPTLSDVAGFQQWLKMNLQPVAGRTHGLANIYIDQARGTIAPNGQLVFPFPDGTVIVKEAVEAKIVAIMRKVKGADPAHGDWQWAEYRADGSIVGKDDGCWGCHTGAKSTDWVFTKLETP